MNTCLNFLKRETYQIENNQADNINSGNANILVKAMFNNKGISLFHAFLKLRPTFVLKNISFELV